MTTTDVPQEAAPFSERLRAATAPDHALAEQAPAMQALVDATLGRAAYAAMLGQVLHLHRALEAAGRQLADDPVAGPFVDPALDRSTAVVADICALVGADHVEVPPAPATASYVRRIEEVAATWPAGFVAHHYVRYLGDLSGGQYLRRVVQRLYGVDDAGGSGAYAFDHLGDLAAYKDGYRRRLDEAPWDDAERARIVEEVHLGYRCNTEVLAAIAIA